MELDVGGKAIYLEEEGLGSFREEDKGNAPVRIS